MPGSADNHCAANAGGAGKLKHRQAFRRGGHRRRPGLPRLLPRQQDAAPRLALDARHPVSVGTLPHRRERRPGDSEAARSATHLRPAVVRGGYGAGGDLAEQQNLGHAGLHTTLGYIRTLDADQRRPTAVYAFDLSQLQRTATTTQESPV